MASSPKLARAFFADPGSAFGVREVREIWKSDAPVAVEVSEKANFVGLAHNGLWQYERAVDFAPNVRFSLKVVRGDNLRKQVVHASVTVVRIMYYNGRTEYTCTMEEVAGSAVYTMYVFAQAFRLPVGSYVVEETMGGGVLAIG